MEIMRPHRSCPGLFLWDFITVASSIPELENATWVFKA